MNRYDERYAQYFKREDDPPGLTYIITRRRDKLIKRLNIKMALAWRNWRR